MKPVEIGLKVHALFEDDIIFTPDLLAVNLEKILDDIKNAGRKSFTLAVEIAYPTKAVIDTLVQKAYRNAYLMAFLKKAPKLKAEGSVYHKGRLFQRF